MVQVSLPYTTIGRSITIGRGSISGKVRNFNSNIGTECLFFVCVLSYVVFGLLITESGRLANCEACQASDTGRRVVSPKRREDSKRDGRRKNIRVNIDLRL